MAIVIARIHAPGSIAGVGGSTISARATAGRSAAREKRDQTRA
jgi:hypothetical protein